MRRWAALGLLASALATSALDGHAGALRYCDAPAELNAAQQDRLFRFAAIIKSELEGSGHALALVSRSGVDLSRFGLRYSHAGIALQASPNAPWSVRQLYYDCSERKPRLFDQGMSGFVVGTGDPAIGHVSAILLPAARSQPLERAALDTGQSLQLLGSSYSANAYAYAVQYQNCNQWVAEMMAVAWGELGAQGGKLRARAQQWLRNHGYTPAAFDIDNPLLMLAGFAVPWLHHDDHPTQAPGRQVFEVSMPASIEAFVQATVPGAQRIEFCHRGRTIVIRRGWQPISEGCLATPGDSVVALD